LPHPSCGGSSQIIYKGQQRQLVGQEKRKYTTENSRKSEKEKRGGKRTLPQATLCSLLASSAYAKQIQISKYILRAREEERNYGEKLWAISASPKHTPTRSQKTLRNGANQCR